MTEQKRRGPLSGIRVLELTNAIAGPFGAMVLGSLGAEVIKIETFEGDMGRRMSGPNYKGESYYHLAFNGNKKSIILDLRTPTGKQAFLDLVKVSDIVWDNYRAGGMQRLGIDFDSLKGINPRIITCSLTGFGQSGPIAHEPAFDIIGLGLSGILSITGEPGRPPVRPGPPIGDLAPAVFGVIGVLSAVHNRDVTGKGQRVDVSMLDACVAFMSYYLSYFMCGGSVPQPEGSKHLSVVPYGVFQTRKGYLALGTCWPRICRVIGEEWMVDDPRFQTHEGRVKHRDLIDSTIQKRFLEGEAADWVELLKAEDIPASLVNDVSQVVVEPQVLHNKMILSLPHTLGGEVRVVGNPMKMPGLIDEETPQETYSAAPALGQHQREVLSGILGYSAEKVEALLSEERAHREELMKAVHKKF